jgi:hypothetical protein
VDTERRGPWRQRARDPTLTALLILQSFILLIAAPAATTGHCSGKITIELAVLAVAAVVFVISHRRVPTAIAVLAIVCGAAGVTMRSFGRSLTHRRCSPPLEVLAPSCL